MTTTAPTCSKNFNIVKQTRDLFCHQKKRIANYLIYWFNTLNIDIEEFIKQILHSQFHLVITVDGIEFIKGFKLPFRQLVRPELLFICQLLKKHHGGDKLFDCTISKNGFSLTYHHFKYDEQLNTIYDPLIYLKVLFKVSRSFFFNPEHVHLVHSYYKQLFETLAHQELLDGHRYQKKLLHIAHKI